MKKVIVNPVYAAASLYLFSIVWCFLFPLVSITTGELKARSLYIDENSLLVDSGSTIFNGKIIADNLKMFQLASKSVTDNADKNYCSILRADFASVSCHHLKKEVDGIIQIVVDHPWKARNLEVTVVVISYHDSNRLQSFAFARALVERLRSSDWMAKRVMILLLPVDCYESKLNEFDGDICVVGTNVGSLTSKCGEVPVQNEKMERVRYSAALAAWLNDYHDSPNPFKNSGWNPSYAARDGGFKFLPHAGLLRDSYVVDFSEPFITTLPIQRYKDGGQRAFWNRVQLMVVGNNGQLPNMDLLTASIASSPHIAVNEADAPALEAGHFGISNSNMSSVAGGRVDLISMCASLFDAHNCGKYFKTLSGLLSFTGALLLGPTGLHGQFIRRNIDSLTLRPIAYESGDRSRVRNSPIAPWAIDDLVSLLGVVERCVHLSSNLQEELHHSHWFYLLMGSKLFVGLSEYAVTLLLALAPLVLLYFRLAYALKPPQQPKRTFPARNGYQREYAAPPVVRGLCVFLQDNLPLWVLVLVLFPAWGSRSAHLCGAMASCMGIFSSGVAVLGTLLQARTYPISTSNSSNASLVRGSSTAPRVDGEELSIDTDAAAPAAMQIAVAESICASVCGGTALYSSEIIPRDGAGENAANTPQQRRGGSEGLVDLGEYLLSLTLCVLLSLSWVGSQHYALAMALSLSLVPSVCAVCVCGAGLGVVDLVAEGTLDEGRGGAPGFAHAVAVGVTDGGIKESIGNGNRIGEVIEAGSNPAAELASKRSGAVCFGEGGDSEDKEAASLSTAASVLLDRKVLRPVSHQGDLSMPSSCSSYSPSTSSILPWMKRWLCRYTLLFFLCVGSPLGIHVMLSLPSFSSCPSIDSLAIDWIHHEVASLAYPCLLLLPHSLGSACLRILLVDALNNIPGQHYPLQAK